VQQVALTAYFLGQMLFLQGEDVSPILAHRAGLLHDMDKRVYKESGIPHGEFGARILEGLGMTDIAGIVRRHQVFSVLDPATAPITWEQILVYIADKYIEKDRFVGLEERFSHFRRRYPDSPQLFDQSLPPAREIENRILSVLSMKRDSLYKELARKIERIPLMD
jgi:putative hydrolase of the HAD superfamily